MVVYLTFLSKVISSYVVLLWDPKSFIILFNEL